MKITVIGTGYVGLVTPQFIPVGTPPDEDGSADPSRETLSQI